MKPKVRFKGFDEEWKENPLISFAQIIGGLTYSPNDIGKKGTLVLRSSNVKNNQIVLEDNVYVYSDKVNVENVEVGDIIMVVRNGSRELIGKHALILEPMSNTVIGAFMSNLRTAHPFFFNTLFSSEAFAKEIDKNAGATINQITNGMFRNMNFHIPQGNEQEAIGEFFRKLDGIIADLDKEIRKLENLKQASLQKMFPQPGESVPQLRVKGFSEPWQEKRLGDLCEYKSSNLSISSALTKGKYQLYDANNLIGYVNSSHIPVEYISIIKDGAGVGRIRILPKNSFIIGTLGAMVPNQSTNLYFLFHCLLNLNLEKGFTGSTIPHIYFKDYGETSIFVPSPDEQKAIGDYFHNLDNIVSAKKKKLEKLRQVKSSCLNLMFVKKIHYYVRNNHTFYTRAGI